MAVVPPTPAGEPTPWCGWTVCRRWRRGLARCRRLLRDERGATGLEFALLLAAVVLPSYAVIRMGLLILAEHYRLMVTLNAMPMP